MNTLEPVLEKVGRVLSDHYGIKVVCEGQRCCTDGNVIYLPALPDDISDDLRDAIRGYLDHECGHVAAASDFAVGSKFAKKYGAEGFGFLNALEDLRVENVMKQRYPGSAVNLANAYRYAVKTTADQVAAGQPIPPVKQLAFAVYTRTQDLPDLPFIDPGAYELASRIDKEIRECVPAPDTKTVARLAEAAWETVRSFLQALPEADNNKESKPSGAPNISASGQGENTPQPGDQCHSQNSSGSNNNSIGDQGQSNSENQPAPRTSSPTANSSTGRSTGIIGGLGEDIANAVSRHAGLTQAYRAWTTARDKVSVVQNRSTTPHADRMIPLMRHVAGVRQRLLQTLLAEVRARWLPDQENGSLNPRALHRLAATNGLSTSSITTPNTAALTRRIFRKRVTTQRLRTAVTLLVDLSHSMSGRKLDIARDSALVLCEALARLDIPVAVWGFSTEHHGKLLRETSQKTGIPVGELERQYRFAPLTHENFKQFDESLRNISGRFEQMRTHMLTPLGESMLFTARELARRPEPRKILLVLTDGRPTVGLDDDVATYRHAKDSIVRIEKAGIEVALVGILERCVLDLHHRAVVVDTLDNLSGTVIAQLQQLLTRQTHTAYRHSGSAA